MFKNRNGYWMDPRFCFMDAPDDGGGAGGEPGAAGDNAPGGNADTGTGNTPAGDTGNGKNEPSGGDKTDNSVDKLNAEIARLNAEMAKQKAALDNATSEAGKLRKELRSKQTQEEIDAQAKKEAEEKQAKEFDDMRRELAKVSTVKTVMGKLGIDEESAGRLADHLYGAADPDNALLEIQKAWQAKEKQLRLEFGKIPPPGSGEGNGPEAQAIARAAAFGKSRNEQTEQAQKAMSAYIR